MARLLITGSTGYIGGELAALARAQGHEVVELGRAAGWRIGAAVPPGMFDRVDAVIHLAHSWAVEEGAPEEANPNIDGAVRLAEAAVQAGVKRFVFASSTSSRSNALNVYGRTKFRIEDRLSRSAAAAAVRIARIGLVYGGPRTAMYGLMLKLSGLSPVLPMIGLSREVQPIHVEEVGEGLLTLALADLSAGEPFVLASASKMSFGAWLRMLRRVQGKGGLIFLPVPIALALLACRMTAFVPLIPTVDPERVLGLAGAAPMESAASLARLGLTIGDPEARLSAELRREEGDVAVTEASVLLTYLAGRAEEASVARLAEALRREGLSPLGLSERIRKTPAILALYEPPATRQDHRLARALYLADLVREAEVERVVSRGFFRSLLTVAIDLGLLPVRLILSGRYR
jgi:nucleoside-diphosphate-sugar epimerase